MVVDPFSTGAVVAQRVVSRGYPVVCVYSDKLDKMESVAALVPDGLALTFCATVEHGGNVQETKAAIEAAANAYVMTLEHSHVGRADACIVMHPHASSCMILP